MSTLLESTNHSSPSVLSTPTASAVGVLNTDPEVVARPVRRRFTAVDNQRIMAETDAAQGSGAIGRIIRREGLYSSHLGKWRKERANSERAALEPPWGRSEAGFAFARSLLTYRVCATIVPSGSFFERSTKAVFGVLISLG